MVPEINTIAGIKGAAGISGLFLIFPGAVSSPPYMEESQTRCCKNTTLFYPLIHIVLFPTLLFRLPADSLISTGAAGLSVVDGSLPRPVR